MPKLPSTGGKGRRAKPKTATKTRASTTTKADAAKPKRRPSRAKKQNGSNGASAATKAKAPAKKATARKPPRAKATNALAEKDFEREKVDEAATHAPAGPETALTDEERTLLGDLFAVIEEYSDEAAERVDRDPVERAFVFSCERHADQRRASGDDFIVHPVGVAKICAGMRLDTATLCAALLHDTVEDTSASLDEVREEFGDEVAGLVDGVTKLSGVTFQSRDDRQAENYRKMM